jgi:hypothetical protein
MRFWIEWVLAMHRAFWFPLFWATGLERPGTELRVEFARAVNGATEPSLVVIDGGLGGNRQKQRARGSRKSA